MISSSYSVKYKQLQRQQIQHLREAQEAERGNISIRSKKLQHETSKRRKALAIRRKLEQAKEERRRQEILARRREEIKSATERYQRLNKGYTPKTDAEIKAALVVSKPPVPLEDALRAVRGSPQPNYNYTHHPSAGYYRQSPTSSGRASPRNQGNVITNENNYNGYYHHGLHQSYNYTSSQKSSTSANGTRAPSAASITRPESSNNVVVPKSDRGTPVSKKEKLHDHSLRNLTNSRSLFEQKLEDQQQSNAEKQKASLAHFNQTLTKELGKDENLIEKHGTVSSVTTDSLESQKASGNKYDNGGNSDYIMQGSAITLSEQYPTKSAPHSSASNSTFVVHRSSASPTVAVVQPSVVRRSPSDTGTRPYNKSNYDLKHTQGISSIYDSLEVSSNKSPVVNSDEQKSNLDNFLQKYNQDKPTMNNFSGSQYNGAMYQEAVVGYTGGIDTSYARPGYNGSFGGIAEQTASDAHIQGAGWIVPSNADIKEVQFMNTQNSTLVTNMKPLSMRNTATNVTVPSGTNGYFLHMNRNEAGVPQQTDAYNTNVSNNRTMSLSNQGKMSVNNNYNSLHGTSTVENAAPTYSTNTNLGNHYAITPDCKAGEDEVDAVPFQYGNSSLSNLQKSYANNHVTTNIPYSSKEGSAYSNTYQVTPGSQNIFSNANHNDLSKVTSDGSGAYNASAYSITNGVLDNQSKSHQVNINTSKAVPVQSPVSSTPTTSGGNTNNSNPTISPKYSVVYSNNSVLQSNSLNARKPPVPAPRTSITNPHTGASANDKIGSQRITIPENSSLQRPGPSKPLATAYNVDPSKIPRPKNPVNLNGENKNTNTREETFSPRSENSFSDVEPESKPEPLLRRGVKGILKKPSSATLPKRTDTFGIKGEMTGRKQRSMSAHARVGIRDSVEVTREHKSRKKRRKKKMVRFVDMVYTNDTETDTDTEQDDYYIEEDVIEEEKTRPATNKRPPARPASAKIGALKPENNPVRNSRVVSAGTQRRGPFHRPHPPNDPPSGRAVMGSSPLKNQSQRTTDNTYSNKIHEHNNQSSKSLIYSSGHDYMDAGGPLYTTAGNSKVTVTKANDGAVYDVNGMRLDRTPTDEEINWLWDKVRTCLNKEDSTLSNNAVTHKSDANQYNVTSNLHHQQPNHNGNHGVNTKYIDGNSIAPQFRTQTRIANPGATPSTTRKVNMDTLSSYSRRASLLNQRKLKDQNNTVGGNITYHQQGDGNSVVQTSVKPLGYQQPMPSSTAPSHGGMMNGYSNDTVTESMAAFLAAEQLATKSISESEMEIAMQEAQSRQAVINSNRQTQKAPSALSIEEQRLMQSLERLNERLKGKGTDTEQSNKGVSNSNTKSDQLTSKPPNYQHGGFKGHAPLSSNHPAKKFINGGSPTGPRQQYRVSSAGAASNRTSIYGGFGNMRHY